MIYDFNTFPLFPEQKYQIHLALIYKSIKEDFLHK